MGSDMRESFMRKILPQLFCFLMLSMTGCDDINRVIGYSVVPESVTIDGVTYRTGFYGDLIPVFGQVGNIGSDTLQDEIAYDDGKRKFQRVDYEGHDWVHSYIGKWTGGVVYCAESQWEQMRGYYTDPLNFDYYCGSGYNISETSASIPEIDHQKFDELLAFGNENEYEPFNERSNEKVMEKTRRIPESEFQSSVSFYKVSNDGYFQTPSFHRFFVYEGKLLLVFFHDGGRDNGGTREVVAIEVPDELGQYFMDLLEQHPGSNDKETV